MKPQKILCILVLLSVTGQAVSSNENNSVLTLGQAIEIALTNDDWFESNKLKQQALEAASISSSQLPDPMISLGLMNVPTDGYEFDQEPMTQAKIGVTQKFPKGKTRSLTSRKMNILATANEILDEQRRAKLALKVTNLWLDTWLAQESISLIEKDRYLFEQLVEVTNSHYTSTSGRARQQDVIRSQLELTKLDDRLQRLQLQSDAKRSMLTEWLTQSFYSQDLSTVFPDTELTKEIPFTDHGSQIEAILTHPEIRIFDRKISAEETQVAIAKQSYKPSIAINASYGYREDAPNGMERDDFASLGMSFDVPLFTGKRQDKVVFAATSRKSALVEDRKSRIKALQAKLQSAISSLENLTERKKLYDDQLLSQMRDQAEASLNSYTSAEGDFSEVMRAQIAELNSKVEYLQIKVKRQKAIAEINYLLSGLKTFDDIQTGENDE